MNRIKNSTAGFTLIELMIVVIIVAVLAAVGIPLLQGNVERAKLTEAVAGLGTIRTAVRAKIAEVGSAPTTATMNTITLLRNQLGLKLGDLTGRFFEDNDYSYTMTAGDPTATPPTLDTYCMTVNGDAAAGEAGASAVKGDDVLESRSMDQDGNLYNAVNCTTANTLIN
jgi:prepilin-type N-terminal cleavage/methylation domain-containing protein